MSGRICVTTSRVLFPLSRIPDRSGLEPVCHRTLTSRIVSTTTYRVCLHPVVFVRNGTILVRSTFWALTTRVPATGACAIAVNTNDAALGTRLGLCSCFVHRGFALLSNHHGRYGSTCSEVHLVGWSVAHESEHSQELFRDPVWIGI